MTSPTFADLFTPLLNELPIPNFMEFDRIKEVYKKVNFVLKILFELKYMEKLQIFKLQDTKCNKKSFDFRLQGNEQFSLKNKKYLQALELYNKSICYSEPGSENLAIGYANRSAILFEWKLYRECLQNIELARKANYPMHLMHKLDKREIVCLQLLDSQPPEIQPYDFQMNFKSHPNLPNIADCLRMRQTPKEGRHIYTTRDLAAGDLVATEEPFCSVLAPEMRYKRCANCKRENYLTLIPCENCCSTMFCSEKCREIAMNGYHKYECPITDFLYTAFPKELLGVRICLNTIGLFTTIEELMNFCDDPVNQNKSVFDLDYKNITPKEHYRAINGLITNQEKRDIFDLFQYTIICAVLKHFLIKHTPLKELLGGEDGQNFFTELLFRHLQIANVNGHALRICQDVIHSDGIFPFHSLLNHSCAQNTTIINKGTKFYLFALRPIPAGGTLYTSYRDTPKEERLPYLLKYYHFNCQCEACENDYPELTNLKPKYNVPFVLNEAEKATLKSYDYDLALKTYKKCCESLNKYASSYPCCQISFAEYFFSFSLNILLDALPLEEKINKKKNEN